MARRVSQKREKTKKAKEGRHVVLDSNDLLMEASLLLPL